MFLLLLGVFLLQLVAASPPITISKQTTHITEPLGANGLPDYEKHLLDVSRLGITPENNAAVPLLQALPPSRLDAADAQALAIELGMKDRPPSSQALEPIQGEAFNGAQWQLWRWLCDKWPNRQNLSDVDAWAERMTDQAVWRPWSTQQMPPLANWVATNQRPFDLIIEASRRPRYFNPSPTLINNQRDLLIDMTYPQAQSVYHACRALLARAMWHVGETRPRDAWNDVHAIYRLSRLLSEGVIPGEQSKARDLNTMACYATETILHHGDLTADDARRIHDDLIRLKPLSIADDSFLLHQRLLALDSFVYVASGGDSDQLSGLIDVYTMVFEWIEPVSIDWNIVLRETNHMYDRVAAAAGAKDRATRINAIETIEKDLARRASSIGELGDLAKAAFNRHERSQLFATVMLGVLLSSFEAATAADDGANAKLELTKLAAALAIYRAEHGRYPEKLDLLVPGLLKEVPRDLFHHKPYIYQPEGHGYLLYSFGENGVDDGGRDAQSYFLESPPFDERGRIGRQQGDPTTEVAFGGDDIAIRVPRPALELPKLAPPSTD